MHRFLDSHTSTTMSSMRICMATATFCLKLFYLMQVNCTATNDPGTKLRRKRLLLWWFRSPPITLQSYDGSKCFCCVLNTSKAAEVARPHRSCRRLLLPSPRRTRGPVARPSVAIVSVIRFFFFVGRRLAGCSSQLRFVMQPLTIN